MASHAPNYYQAATRPAPLRQARGVVRVCFLKKLLK